MAPPVESPATPSASIAPGLVSRKIPSQNIATRLMYREMFGSSYRCIS